MDRLNGRLEEETEELSNLKIEQNNSHLSEWLLSVNQQTASAGENAEGNPYALLVGLHIGAATVENSMELPQKN